MLWENPQEWLPSRIPSSARAAAQKKMLANKDLSKFYKGRRRALSGLSECFIITISSKKDLVWQRLLFLLHEALYHVINFVPPWPLWKQMDLPLVKFMRSLWTLFCLGKVCHSCISQAIPLTSLDTEPGWADFLLKTYSTRSQWTQKQMRRGPMKVLYATQLDGWNWKSFLPNTVSVPIRGMRLLPVWNLTPGILSNVSNF